MSSRLHWKRTKACHLKWIQMFWETIVFGCIEGWSEANTTLQESWKGFFCAIRLGVIWEYSRNTYGFTMALLKKDEIPPQLPWISMVTEAILVGVMTIPLGWSTRRWYMYIYIYIGQWCRFLRLSVILFGSARPWDTDRSVIQLCSTSTVTIYTALCMHFERTP